MSNNLGVRLTLGVLSGLSMGIYVPRTYQPKTYERSSLGGVINLAQFDTTFKKQAAAGCVGVSQTFTTAGTISFTPNCTGTLTFQTWGGGAGGDPLGAGGTAYAESALSVVNGTAWIGRVGAGGAAGTAGSVSYLCDTGAGGGAGCSNALTICSGTGLNNTNFVCASPGGASGLSSGGRTVDSVGVTLHKGGDSINAVVACGGYNTNNAGGGAAGPQGDGNNSSNKGDGGSADAGSGGAGGTCSGIGTAGSGGSDAAHGGGGGGSAFPGGGSVGGSAGVPGGGGGSGATKKPGGNGEVIIHSDASDVLAPVMGSHHGCGIVLTA